MALFLFGISGGEIIIVFLVVLVLFGADKIPGLAKTLGKGMHEFKKATDEIKREIRDSAADIKDDLLEARNMVTSEADDIKKELRDPIGYDPYDMSEEGTEHNPDQPEISSTRKRKPKTTKTDAAPENGSNNKDVDNERYNK